MARGSDYEKRLKALRGYVRTGIRARKHFTPAEKAAITRAWNDVGALVERARKGELAYRDMKPRASRGLGFKRRTNKGVFLPPGSTSRLVRGKLHIRYGANRAIGRGSYRSVLYPLDRSRDLKEQMDAIMARHPGANFSLSVNGFKQMMERTGTSFADYWRGAKVPSGIVTGLYVTPPLKPKGN